MVEFDEQRFPKDTETNFKGQNGKHYRLEDVWFMLQHREKPWLQYVKECNAFKFQIVSFLDHKDLLSYLTGKTDTSTKITAPVEYVAPSSAASGATSAGGLADPTARPATAAAAAAGEAVPTEQLGAEPMDIDADDAGSSQMQELPVSIMDVMQDDPNDNNAAAKEQRPLTDAELKVKQRKEETMQRDREQLLKIGEDREMKLREILDDADAVELIRLEERPSVTKEMLLQSSTRDFKHILNLMYLRQTDGKHRMRGTTSAAGGSVSALKRARGASSASLKGDDKRKRSDAAIVPIIIVPAAPTSLITLVNAKDFFEHGQWISAQKKKEDMRAAGVTFAPGQRVLFNRLVLLDDGSESKTCFEVVDNTRSFKKDDWNRVIAVFTNGKEWEFKGWKLGEPSNMFHKITGFFVNFRQEKTPQSIGAWKVKVLSLEKNARHSDITAQRQFWDSLKADSAKNPLFADLFV